MLGVPAVGLVALRHILGERDGRIILDGNAVVVPDDDEVAQLLRARQRRRLGGHALLHTAVAANGVDVVVEGAFALGGTGIEKPMRTARGHRHAYRSGDSLAERAGGDFYALGVPVLGMARGGGAFRTKRGEIVHLQAVAGEEQLNVLRERGMPGREHETVAAKPLIISRVVAQDLLVEQVRGGSKRYRGSRVAVADLLDSICGENTGGVHGPLI